MIRHSRIFFALLLAVGPFAWSCKKEEPPPTPTAEEPEEEKPKKKKKKVDDEEIPDIGGTGADDTGPGTAAGGAWKAAPKTDSGKSATDADKQKLIACCTALRNAATAAGIANSAASAAVPGMPAPPPKEELDKAVVECDKQVVNWSGDLNSSLKNVKGATSVKLPNACFM
jgi:hypothetical protein